MLEVDESSLKQLLESLRTQHCYLNVSKSASDALVHSCAEAVAKIMAIVERLDEE